MARKLIASLLALLALASLAPAGRWEREAIARANPAVVLVHSEHPTAWGGEAATEAAGVLVDSRGWIVTNCHVVGRGMWVRLHDGRTLFPEVVARDERRDLALLHVAGASGLPTLELGRSRLRQGDDVLIVGHPYEFKWSASRGMVAGCGREITMPSGATLSGLYQLDGAINPGNSGGPILDRKGRWVALAVAMREGADGVGFVIPAGQVRTWLKAHMPPRPLRTKMGSVQEKE